MTLYLINSSKVKVICQVQGQILRVQFKEKKMTFFFWGGGGGALVFHKGCFSCISLMATDFNFKLRLIVNVSPFPNKPLFYVSAVQVL